MTAHAEGTVACLAARITDRNEMQVTLQTLKPLDALQASATLFVSLRQGGIR
jgi:hypothetical protein